MCDSISFSNASTEQQVVSGVALGSLSNSLVDFIYLYFLIQPILSILGKGGKMMPSFQMALI